MLTFNHIRGFFIYIFSIVSKRNQASCLCAGKDIVKKLILLRICRFHVGLPFFRVNHRCCLYTLSYLSRNEDEFLIIYLIFAQTFFSIFLLRKIIFLSSLCLCFLFVSSCLSISRYIPVFLLSRHA